MELRNYLAVLWRRKWIVIITCFVTVAIVAIGTSLVTPVYRATATLRVLTPVEGVD